MKQLLANLGARERLLLILGTALVIVLLLYVTVLKPLSDRNAQLRTAIAEQSDLYLWMQETGAEIRRLRGGQTVTRDARQSLLALTDRTARERGLGGAIRRVEPEGSSKVRMQLERAPFDDMVSWLEFLTASHGVRIETITIESRDETGLVNARLTIETPA